MLAASDKGKGKDSDAVSAGADDDTCIICLHRIRDRTILPKCSHDLQCFNCFIEWAKYSHKCPLCVSDIGPYIIHNVRSKHDYEKHYVSPPRSQEDLAQILSVRSSIDQSNSITRRRKRAEGPEEPDIVETAIVRRRYIYRHGLYAKHVASNRYTRYMPHPNPAQVSNSVELQRRAAAFLRRELRVWINLDVEFLTNYVVTLIKMLDLRSEAGVKLLSELLDPSIPYTIDRRKPNTEHLAHELYSFLRSPYKSLEDYDSAVQYDETSNNNMRKLSPSEDQPVSLSQPRPEPSSLRHSSKKRYHSTYDDNHRSYSPPRQRRRHHRHDHNAEPEDVGAELPNVHGDCQNSTLLPSSSHSKPQYIPSPTKSNSKAEEIRERPCTPAAVPSSITDPDHKSDKQLTLEPDVLMEYVRQNIANKSNPGIDIGAKSNLNVEESQNLPYRIEDSRRQELFDKIKEEKTLLENPEESRNDDQEMQDTGEERNVQQKQREAAGIGRPSEISIRGAAARAKALALQEAEARLRTKALLRIRLSREKALAASAELMRKQTVDEDTEQHVNDGEDDFKRTTSIIVADHGQESRKRLLQEKLLKEHLLLQRLNTPAH